MFRLLLGLIMLVASVLLGQHLLQNKATSLTDAFPHRQQLLRAARYSNSWLVVYQANSPEEQAAYEKLLRPLEEQSFRNISLKVFQLEQAPDSLLRKYPLMLIGKNLPEKIKTHLTSLPALEFTNSTRIGEWSLDQDKDLLQLTYLPSYWQDTLPMHLIWSKDEAVIQNYLQERLARGIRSFLWSAWGYEVQRSGKTYLQGYFNDSTWVMDKEIHFEFAPTAQDSWTNASAKIQAFDEAPAPPEAWLNELTEDQLAIQEFTGTNPLSPLNIMLYPSVERKALRTKSMAQAHPDEDGETVHLVINNNFQGQEWGVQYQAWLRSALGNPKHPFYEEGLALQWINTIRGRAWRSWVYSLADAEALPPFALLFDENDRQQQSPLIGKLAAAAWVDYRLQKLGKVDFLQEYINGASVPSVHEHSRWISWIKENYPAPQETPKVLPQHRLNGFTLAHEGYRIYNGYGSSLALQSLMTMKQVGIAAVAIVPYSFMSNANRPDPIPVSQNAGSENDEATIFSHLSAQSLGQFTLLKPQIWLGGGSWPGDVTFEREQDWQTFFTHYGRWAHHYALIAEMYGFDAYCLGTELRYATLKKPAEWRKLIASTRKIYTGSLTYAANWGEECEKLEFWSDLDFIGINCYYPLHKDENATDLDLQKGAERVVKKMEAIHEKAQRPVWLTEIGYRSATAPWQQPHAEAGSRAIDNEAQARCYEAMLAACKDASWLKGFFWWKWPSDLNHDESRGRGYTPAGKPAEKVLNHYYLNS